MTLIAADIAKLWVKFVEKDPNGICTETDNPAYSPVLRKPNRFSTRVKFFEHWILSKLSNGNTYVLKERDGRRVVKALYVLDPTRVQVLVAPDGGVYYQLATDYLSGLPQVSVTVPASEIIHDICVPLFHPLCGVAPLYACALAATQGLKIQELSAKHFDNGTQISGVLTAPGTISEANAKRVKDHWDANFTGENNIGKVAVLGDGLKFEPMMMTAVNAQLIEQLKWSGEQICSTYHVPGYMVGIGPAPPYTDIQSINLQYYTQALQNPIENLEILLEEGLEIDQRRYGIEFDLEALARMDLKTQMDIATKGVAGAVFTPNEGRARLNHKPKTGGDDIYLQQQNYSLPALHRRDQEGPAPSTTPSAQLSLKVLGAEKSATSNQEFLAEAAAMRLRKALAA